MNNPNYTRMNKPLITRDEVYHNAGWFIALGAGLIILGILALGSLVLTTLVSVIFLGWLLAVAGALQILHAFKSPRWSGFFLNLLGGALGIVVGLLMATKPALSALSLTLIMAIFFLVSGIFRAITAVVIRFTNWLWFFLSGCVSIIVGMLILAEWPVSGLWAIGLFIGVDLIIVGWTYVMLGVAARALPHQHHEASH